VIRRWAKGKGRRVRHVVRPGSTRFRFGASDGRIVASMSEIDPRVDTPLVKWGNLGVSGLLPTGTVTLLLAHVVGSTRLWETEPEAGEWRLRWSRPAASTFTRW
jgi:hypothetical protein